MLPATSWVHYTKSCNTQSSVPVDGENNCPKHVELTGIINKPLFLHLVGCLYYLYQWCTVKQISNNEIYLLIKYIKSVLWKVAKHLSYIEDARCLKVKLRHHCYISTSFLCAFTKLPKATISYAMSVRLSARNNLTPTVWIFRWIFIKSDISIFRKSCVQIQVALKSEE